MLLVSLSRPLLTDINSRYLVMYHPKEDYEISYEDTTEIDFSKPKTAEEVGRKLLKLNQLDNVEIENHYHTRTFPAPDGSDVNTVSEIYRIVATKSFFFCSDGRFVPSWRRNST